MSETDGLPQSLEMKVSSLAIGTRVKARCYKWMTPELATVADIRNYGVAILYDAGGFSDIMTTEILEIL